MKYYGIDDGHDGIKIVNDIKSYIPSKIISGKKIMLDTVTGENNSHVYSIDTNYYTVIENDYNSSLKFLETRTEDFPSSNINNVLVNHALFKAGASGDIAICTGLPFNRYYKDSAVNHTLINKKKANLNKHVSFDNKNFNIVKQYVCSEGVAAYFDLTLNDDGSTNQEFVDYIGSEATVVVDIGGRTTDIVTLYSNSIDFERSCTLETGGLNAKDKLRELLKLKLDTYNIPEMMLDKIISSNGHFKNSTLDINATSELLESKSVLAEEIVTKLKQLIGNSVDVGLIVFCGGGSLLLKHQLMELFHGDNVKFVNDPINANARGMKKLLIKSIGDMHNE